MKIAMIAFSDKGMELSFKLTGFIEEEVVIFDKTKASLKEWLKDVFYSCKAIIFICAVGIAVRLVADLLVSKERDPAVVVIDEMENFVIPILSGHIGGSNALALKLAKNLNSTPVITTATDLHNKFAVDVWSTTYNCAIEDINKIKVISSKILKDEKIAFESDFDGVGDLPKELYFSKSGDAGICISLDINKKPFLETLKVMPKILTIGIGCRKGILFEDLESFILKIFKDNNISLKAVKYVASIELKKNEPCIIEFAKKYKVDFITFTSEQLNSVVGNFTKSAFVESITGVDNICERSAVLSSKGDILVGKVACNGITVAVAKAKWQYCF